jgi:hypothetical protein
MMIIQSTLIIRASGHVTSVHYEIPLMMSRNLELSWHNSILHVDMLVMPHR